MFVFYFLQLKSCMSLKSEDLLCCVVCLLQEQVKRLHVHVEEVINENERLHDEIAKIGGVNKKDW